MRAAPIVMCCWPGLPRLWLRGDGGSLALALVFGAALNLLLVSTAWRNGWLPSPVGTLAWFVVGGLWLAATIREYRKWPELCQPVSAADDRGLFLQAQGEYLQGHWFEAETMLGELLRKSPGDIDAGLLRATLYRRTKRYTEASAELGRLEHYEMSAKWQAEIAVERRLIRDRMSAELDQDQKTRNQESSKLAANGLG